MRILEGVVVSKGIAAGKAVCLDFEFMASNQKIPASQVQAELKKLEDIVISAIDDIDAILIELDGSKNEQEILATHKMILQDPEMHKNIESILKEELVSLERALELNLKTIENLFSGMDDDYLSARVLDYKDVTNRLINKLNQREHFSESWEKRILVASEITPSQVLEGYKQKAAGLVSLHGSSKSHTAILARSLMLPYITEIKNFKETELCDIDLIIDGYQGCLIIDPTEEKLLEYKKKLAEYQKEQRKLEDLSDKKTLTKDGKRIPLYCNIEIPEELEALKKYNIDGIGLFRTEFLYLDRTDLPDEEEQFAIYKEVAKSMAPRVVIIRTIDLGGDKVAKSLFEPEENPNLGLRGIRLSFKFQEIFRAQIKAILRASVFGNIKIMFPMISSVKEIERAQRLIKKCQSELDDAGEKYAKNIKIGTMIEIPSAAIRASEISEACDFLSIGTNDLVQYTLAVDRNNDLVGEYYNETDPAVLTLIKQVCQAAHAHGIKVAVCGEMAAQEKFTGLLIGLGVDELSTSPNNYGVVKKAILGLDSKESQEYADSLLI